MTGLLATAATATPLRLEYDVTITGKCFRATGLCSTASIGGLNLTITTNDTIVSQNTFPPPVPDTFTSHFGPSTLAMDSSRVGSFASPYGDGVTVQTFQSSYISNSDYGFFESTRMLVGNTYEQVLSSDTSSEIQEYLVYQRLDFTQRGMPDGIPRFPTMADVGITLAQDLPFLLTVRASTCRMVASENCVYDPRSFDAFGVARFRESTIPVPEPATVVLFSLGLAGIAATRRRRRAKAE
jgi:hypothetical protein